MVEDESNPEYAGLRGKVVFINLLPYSPDLNPIEQDWRMIRREKPQQVLSLCRLRNSVLSHNYIRSTLLSLYLVVLSS